MGLAYFLHKNQKKKKKQHTWNSSRDIRIIHNYLFNIEPFPFFYNLNTLNPSYR